MAKLWNDHSESRYRRDSRANRLALDPAYLCAGAPLDVDGGIEARDWLTLPEQRLRVVTAGAVYHDEVGLPVLRDRLAYYPHDGGPIDDATLRQTVSPSNPWIVAGP